MRLLQTIHGVSLDNPGFPYDLYEVLPNTTLAAMAFIVRDAEADISDVTFTFGYGSVVAGEIVLADLHGPVNSEQYAMGIVSRALGSGASVGRPGYVLKVKSESENSHAGETVTIDVFGEVLPI